MGPISKKVIAGLKKAKTQKIVDLQAFKQAKAYAEDLDKTVVSGMELSKYDPLHALYIYGQNKVSVFVEELSGLPALSKLTDMLDKADDIYQPSSPPMSPLSQSYFTCWGFFDLCLGLKKESFGTVIRDLLNHLNADTGLIKIVEYMQNSRMGIYLHKGVVGKFVVLEELVTGKEIKVIVPSGYQGKKNEIWFARVLPGPFPELDYGYSVVFTTPYILIEYRGDRGSHAKRTDWEDFFDRTLKTTGQKDKLKAYEALMKYGLNRHYWNEYIFEGYVNYQTDMILLAGVPDIPLSLPHSRESQEARGEM